MAVYCLVTPGWTDAFDGVTCRAVIVFPPGKNCPQPATVNRIAIASAAGRMSRYFATSSILPFGNRSSAVP